MKFLFSWLFAIPFALCIILFAVSNREIVTISLFPLPFLWDMPLFVLVLGAMIFGFLWGGVAVWVADNKLRKRVREETRIARKLKESVLREEARADQAEARLERFETSLEGRLPPAEDERGAKRIAAS